MSLLTVAPYDAQKQTAWAGDIIRLAAQMEESRAKMAEAAKARSAQQFQQSLQDQRRGFEFDRKMEYDRARTAADDARADSRLAMEKEIFTDDRAPFMLPGSAPVRPSGSVPALSSPNAPSPSVPMKAPNPELDPSVIGSRLGARIGGAMGMMAGAPDFSSQMPQLTTGETPAPAGAPGSDEPVTIPGFEPPTLNPPTLKPLPDTPPLTASSPESSLPPAQPKFPRNGVPSFEEPSLPKKEPVLADPVSLASNDLFPPPADSSASSQVAQTAKELAASGLFTKKEAVGILKQTAASVYSRKPASATSSPVSSQISAWPINERGYRFNPSEPEQMFMERHGPKGPTFTQIRTTDPGYGLKPSGDGLFEDTNGGRYFVKEVRKGVPQYTRVEEDEKVTYRAKDNQGRIRSHNQFGAEVAVTDERVSFLTPKSKLMPGSDGNVYAFGADGKPVGDPPPQGVTFNKDSSKQAKRFMVASDGKVYAFGGDGNPINEIPDGVRFDRPKDPAAIAKWEVDETTGDLHGFNYLGTKVAENEGDYARINASGTAGGVKAPTMSDDATYQAVMPTVRGLWEVYDSIREMSQGKVQPHASHTELIQAFGDVDGRKISTQRAAAQQAASSLSIRGRRVGRDFAEGFVKAYELRTANRTGAPAAAAPAPARAVPEEAPVAPAPAAPVAAAPAAPPAYREDIGGTMGVSGGFTPGKSQARVGPNGKQTMLPVLSKEQAQALAGSGITTPFIDAETGKVLRPR